MTPIDKFFSWKGAKVKRRIVKWKRGEFGSMKGLTRITGPSGRAEEITGEVLEPSAWGCRMHRTTLLLVYEWTKWMIESRCPGWDRSIGMSRYLAVCVCLQWEINMWGTREIPVYRSSRSRFPVDRVEYTTKNWPDLVQTKLGYHTYHVIPDYTAVCVPQCTAMVEGKFFFFFFFFLSF